MLSIFSTIWPSLGPLPFSFEGGGPYVTLKASRSNTRVKNKGNNEFLYFKLSCTSNSSQSLAISSLILRNFLTKWIDVILSMFSSSIWRNCYVFGNHFLMLKNLVGCYSFIWIHKTYIYIYTNKWEDMILIMIKLL